MALLLCVGPIAAGDGGMSFSGGGSGTTGTLPATAPNHGGLPIEPAVPPSTGVLLQPAKPAITLTGYPAELNQVIAGAYGAGWYTTSSLANGELTITYHGDVTLDLHPTALLGSGVTTSLAIDPSFNGGKIVVVAKGLQRNTQLLRTGNQNVQLHRMIRSGLVERGVAMRAFNSRRTQSSAHSIRNSGNGIRIVQTH